MSAVAVAERVAVDDERAEWLAARRKGIGGSDAAGILGASPWSSPWSVWAEKTGLVTAPAPSDPDAVEWGAKLEALVAAKFEAVTGHRLERGGLEVVVDPEHQHMLGTPDAYALDGSGRRVAIVEIKTAGEYALSEWESAGPPVHYQIQVQHYMRITGLRRAWIACLFGGRRYRHWEIEYNPTFVDGTLVPVLARFWRDHVVANLAPVADGSDATADAIRAAYPLHVDDEPLALTHVEAGWAQELEEAKADVKEAEARKVEAENKLKAAIGEHAAGQLPDGTVYTYKAGIRAGFTVEPSTVRTLRRKAAKKTKGE